MIESQTAPGPRGHDLGGIDAEPVERPRPRPLDDHVGLGHQPPQLGPTLVGLERHGPLLLAGVEPLVELPVPRRAPSGRVVDSTFTTPAPARVSSRAHVGPAHSDERSTTRSPATVRSGAGRADHVPHVAPAGS